ncbi:hypothetical protein Nepgr_017305 [Nepenthes gracilis]|uniref:Mediator complex subunit 15 KIX domain-containing protein n=1 Tax=Nepenthes gracilis TaxID=150966 RepID=A0AAD3XSZ3_NEPGR|nr:hypothetical protein Nepgr_017305 [Nepenthes gracilis]
MRFEEKIYTEATSQSDYLRKISLKMLKMESKSQNNVPNAIASNSTGMGKNQQDSASLDSTAQTGNTVDWQEEVYQKIKAMKELYYADLNEMYQKISLNCSSMILFLNNHRHSSLRS